jgi:tetratricopeptide (TPR) repeat protein
MKKRTAGQVEPPSQAIRHFTDRENERDLFARYLDQRQGEHLPVLSFYGVGGTGKTWLLQKLREIVSARGDTPHAHLDFSLLKGGEVYQRDPAAALAEIQRQLGVDCPRFEVAYNVMLWKQGKRDSATSSVEEAASTGWQIAIALGQDAASALVPGVNVAGKLLEKLGASAGRRLRGTALGRWLESHGTDEFLKGLMAKTAQEILAEMVDHLALDLAEGLPVRSGKACRAVLFFDTFEDLVRGAGRGPTRQRSARQQWIQDLYRALLDDADEPRGTVLFVIGGRDQLVWDDDFDDRRYLDQHRVGGLSRVDALRFLSGCGIADAALQEAILRVSTEAVGGAVAARAQRDAATGFHPFTLGLCADTVVTERSRGREPDAATFSMSPGDVRKLVERFLASFDGAQEAYIPWMYRLALAPRWDELSARRAYSPVDDAQQDAAWDTLVSYSFVQPPVGDDPWWTLHARMGDALRARHADSPDRVRRDHIHWRGHWQERSTRPTDVYAGHAWYHHFRLDPRAALQDWDTLATECTAALRMAEHHELLGWWAPTGLPDGGAAADDAEALAVITLAGQLVNASLGDPGAAAERAIACFQAALGYFTPDQWPLERAKTLVNLAGVISRLPRGDRTANLRTAAEYCEEALQVLSEEADPEGWGWAMHNLGLALVELPGEGPANIHRAMECFRAALRVRTEEDLPLERATTLVSLGNAHTRLPESESQEHSQAAIECYESALRLLDEQSSPRAWATALNNLGSAYRKLTAGNRGENVRRAIECLTASLRVHTEDVLPQEWAMTMTNLGTAYQDQPDGDSSANLERAIECYLATLRVYREDVLPLRWATIMNNLGLAYRSLETGDRAANLRRAIGFYEAALRMFSEEALPYPWATTVNNLGVACVYLANIVGRQEQAPDTIPEGDGKDSKTGADPRESLNWLATARGAFLEAERGFRKLGHDGDADVAAENARRCAEGMGLLPADR